MITCQDCGTEVRFVLLGFDEERKRMWSPPMVAVTREVKRKRAKGFEFPPLTVIETFEPHNCEQRQQRLAEELHTKQVRQQRAATDARRTEEAWAEALKRDCPKCKVPEQVRCLNLTDVRLGRPGRATRWPHAERLPADWVQQQV